MPGLHRASFEDTELTPIGAVIDQAETHRLRTRHEPPTHSLMARPPHGVPELSESQWSDLIDWLRNIEQYG